MDAQGDLRPKGEVSLTLIKASGEIVEHAEAPVVGAPWRPRLKNGWKVLRQRAKFWVARRLHIAHFRSVLRLRHYDASRGVWVDYGAVGMKSVTDAGVEYLADDWLDDSEDQTIMRFAAFGTGVVGENVTDTLLGTEVETRESGTKSQPVPEDLRVVATHTFAGTFAITEHGIFSVITTATITLWDRTVFGAINVDSGDAIEATYTCTINSGG